MEGERPNTGPESCAVVRRGGETLAGERAGRVYSRTVRRTKALRGAPPLGTISSEPTGADARRPSRDHGL
jgi:hypothetical protein